jgi:predicted aspartyl protease
MGGRIGIACLALLSSPAAAAAPVADPYAPLAPGSPAVAQLVRDAEFGLPGADGALGRWLDGHPEGPAADRRLGQHVLCNIYGARTLNLLRAQACAAERAAGGTDEDLAVSAALRDVPPVRAIGSTSVKLTKNFWGVTSASVTVNGIALPWFVDTGAEISVLSKSAADRVHPRYLGRSISSATSTADVKGELAVIDVLRIGDAWAENVPVLVLPDSNLSIGGGPLIQAILGLQVFNAFRRMAWLDHGTILALGETAPPVTNPKYRLYWHEDGVGLPLATAAGTMGAHFDSGANRTDLRPPFVPLLSRAEQAAAVERELRTGGAGGIVTRREKHFPSVSVTIGGTPLTLQNVAVDSRTDADAARVGMDTVFPTRLFVLDFEHMTFRVER